MKNLLLILSLSLGLASPAFAFPKAGTVIAQGKIINKEYKWYDDDDGKTVYYWELIVAHDNIVYKCRIVKKSYEVSCISFFDKGVF